MKKLTVVYFKKASAQAIEANIEVNSLAEALDIVEKWPYRVTQWHLKEPRP